MIFSPKLGVTLKFLIVMISLKFACASRNNTTDFCKQNCGRQKNICCVYSAHGFGPHCKGLAQVFILDVIERTALVNLHNQFRVKIATGQFPYRNLDKFKASDMHVLSYSRQLEYSSSCWARQCKISHSRCRAVEDGTLGEITCFIEHLDVHDSQIPIVMRKLFTQCLSTTVSRFQLNFTKEFIEELYWPIGGDDETNRAAIQIIWSKARYIGCTLIKYKHPNPIPELGEYEMILLQVCHFFPDANKQRGKPVFRIGKPAGDCPDGEQPNEQFPELCGVIRSIDDDLWIARNHVREFSCGPLYYRTFFLDTKKDALYVGAMDRVYRLNLSNINQSNCERDSLILEPTLIDNCVSKGKSEHFDCRNHIRVIQSIGDGDRLYICGTNAHNPKDWVVHANLTHLSRNTFVPGIGLGIAKCPYDPTDNSTAIWVEKGNPGDLPGLYSGTNAEFTKADTVIFRTDLYNLTTGRKEFTFKRTLKYDSKWLDKPNFVGSFDIGESVLFFFRETAVEYINCGKSVYSRVARVCKKDTGGKNILVQNWSTYLKARLNCSIPGEFPFYFNEIQSIYKIPGDDQRFYGTFTTSTNGLMGSAICSFSLKDIQASFNGKFKEQATSSSAWLPVLSSRVPEPRPGTCVDDTETLPDTVLNFIRSHPLMDSAVMHENEKPVYFKRDLFFTRLVVDRIKVDIGGEIVEYTVYYAGTNDGRVHKIVEWVKLNEESSSSILLDVFDITPGEPIQVMEISKVHKALYVASDNRVKQIDLVMCNRRYDNCLRCVHDPYCGWDKESNVCKPYAPGLLQDVSNSTGHICDSSIVKKKMVVTWGQSLHLGCFLKMPAVLSSQTITWYHYSKEKGKYKIIFRPDKYIETSEHGLVIIAVTEADAGRYDCWMGGSLLCSYNVTVDAHRCSPPAKSNDYQKIYSDWCHEFEKYKSAMKTWERKQAQCSSRQNDSNQNSHPNEIYRTLV